MSVVAQVLTAVFWVAAGLLLIKVAWTLWIVVVGHFWPAHMGTEPGGISLALGLDLILLAIATLCCLVLCREARPLGLGFVAILGPSLIAAPYLVGLGVEGAKRWRSSRTGAGMARGGGRLGRSGAGWRGS